MEKIKVLVVTNMYPDTFSQKGIFVKEQIHALSSIYGSKICFHIFSTGNRKGALKYFSGTFSLLWILIIKKFDIIHVHYGLSWLMVILSYPILKIKKIKIVTTFHGSDLLGDSAITKIISILGLRLTGKAIFVSREMANRFRKQCKKKDCVIIPCGVDDSFFLEQPDDDFASKNILLFPSSPDRPEKNYTRFSRLSSTIIRNNDWLRAEVLEGLSRDEVLDLLKNTYAVMMTSLREGSPQLVKEALAMGVPVLASDVGDLQEMRCHTMCLFICSEDDDFISAFDSIKSDYPLDEISLKHDFYKNYSNNSIAEKIYDIYVSL